MDAGSTQEASVYLGVALGHWIQSGAIFSAIAAALLTTKSSEKSSRHRATIDLILNQQNDEKLNNAKKAITRIRSQNNHSFATYASPKNEDETEELNHILAILNHHEFASLAIREKAIDDAVYKRAFYSQIIKDWESFEGLITELRRQKQRPTLFQEFETLRNRWKNKPLKADKVH